MSRELYKVVGQTTAKNRVTAEVRATSPEHAVAALRRVIGEFTLVSVAAKRRGG